jgi:hypothetical protein
MITLKQAMAGLLACAALVIVIQQERLHRATVRDIRVGLSQDSLDASHDTTRVVRVMIDTGGGDSIRVWQRRAEQATQRADALDRVLREERVARADVRLSAPSLDTTVTLPARGAEQVIRQAPYTLSIAGATNASSDSNAVVGLHLTMDTLALGVRIGCGAANPLGVRPTSVSVSAPAWATVRMDRVEQDPSVCNAKALATVTGGGAVRGLVRRFGVTVGYSVVVVGGEVVSRPGVTVGFRIWP